MRTIKAPSSASACPCPRGSSPRPTYSISRRTGWTAPFLVACAVVAAANPAAAQEVAFLGHPVAHNLYIRNADGNLFRWGEPRYGPDASARASAVVPYFESVLAVPRSPSGADWQQASGYDHRELFLDAAGRVFVNRMDLEQPGRLIEVVHPVPGGTWVQVSNGGGMASLVDQAGEFYELSLDTMLSWMFSPGTVVPTPNPWLVHVPRPASFDPLLAVEHRLFFSLALAASGELFGRGYSHWGLTGSIPIAAEGWQLVARPAGVGAWVEFDASFVSAVARGDDGEAYYWGQPIPGAMPAGADPRIPAKIGRPAGVTGWKSVAIAGSLVLLVSNEGQVYGFGSGSPTLYQPFQPPGGGPLLVATPADPTVLTGVFDSVHCGSDHVVARRSDDTAIRWGVFMRLENLWSAPGVIPGPMPVPPEITALPQRLAPGARVLSPGPFDRLPVGTPVTFAAEVFPLEGTLSSVEFLVNEAVIPGLPQVEGNVAQLGWSAAAPGEHALKVRVADAAGRTTVSQPVSFSVRHAVNWTLATNRIAESAVNGLATTTTIEITRTELPYPNYHEFSYRFRFAPLAALGRDIVIAGATSINDGSGNWEVLFAPGQKNAAVSITALPDQFTEQGQSIYLEPAYDWATERDYLHPANTLNLEIVDTTPTGGASPVQIVDDPATRFGFAFRDVPVTVRVPKSLTPLPNVQLIVAGFFHFETVFVDELPDHWLIHLVIRNLPPGLHTVTARAYDSQIFGQQRYRDSLPVSVRVWDTTNLPTVRVVAGEATVNEADEPQISLHVMRDGPTESPLEVVLDVRGTALGGLDYDALPVSVVIPAGASYVGTTVQIREDAHAELDETILIAARQRACEQLECCAIVDAGSALRVVILDGDGVVSPEVSAQVLAHPSSDSSFLISASGRLYAWGQNSGGALGLGDLPPELDDYVPWPRPVPGLGANERWQSLLVGPAQALGTSDLGNGYVWGAGFASPGSLFNIRRPQPVVPLPAGATALAFQQGHLLVHTEDLRLEATRVTTATPPQLQPNGVAAMPVLRMMPQGEMLAVDGVLYHVSDWSGRHPIVYPLEPDAGYWRDIASTGSHILAVDEHGRLYRMLRGPQQYDPQLRRSRFYFTAEPMSALPGGRAIARLLGNELEVVALTADGYAYTLAEAATSEIGAAAQIAFPEGVSRWVSFAAGRRHFLAVGDNGNVYAWGDNASGQLGHGGHDPAGLPLQVPSFAGVNDPQNEEPTVSVPIPPLVRFDGMAASYSLDGPEPLAAWVSAFDPDGTIDRVEILLDGEVVAAGVWDPGVNLFVAEVMLPRPGDFTLTARAWDDSALFADTAGIPVHVDDPARYPRVKVWNVVSGTAEGYGFPGYFEISRQGIADVPLTVHFAIHGTATEGSDYPALPRNVVIPAGAASVLIPVIARPDFIDEDTEEVQLTILNAGCNPDTAEPYSGCYRIEQPHNVSVYVLDYLRPGDAYLPFVSMSLDTFIAREGTTSVARFEVRRHGVYVENLPVRYELGGTAVNGVDYAPLSGTVIIPAGADRATFTVTAIEDFVTEPWETVTVKLLNPGCAPGQTSADGCYLSHDGNEFIVYVGDKPEPPPLPPGVPGPSSTPQPVLFDELENLPGQGTIVRIVSERDAVFVLETSTDLLNWEALGQFTSVSGRLEFVDLDAAHLPRRFYRTVPAVP